MLWLFNPAEPTSQPARSGIRGEGVGDQVPSVPPYYALQVPPAVHPIEQIELFPHAKGTFVLEHMVDHQIPAIGDADLTAPRYWRGPITNDLGDRWWLGFGFGHPDNGQPSQPIVAIPSWSVWFGAFEPAATETYVLWDDPDHSGFYNRFLPLRGNTFRTRHVRVGTANALPADLFAEFPESLTVTPWWP